MKKANLKKTISLTILIIFSSLMTIAILNQFVDIEIKMKKQERNDEIFDFKSEDFFIDEEVQDEENKEDESIFTQNYNIPFVLNFISQNSLTLQRVDNDKFDIQGNEGKALLFVFISQQCKQCEIQIDILNKMQKSDKLQIIGILVEQMQEDELEAFIKENNINFELSNDYANNEFFIKALRNIDALPYMLLFKKNGQIFDRFKGIIPSEMLEIEIKRLINV